jgi:DNA-binding MarR family transcriptional regulator
MHFMKTTAVKRTLARRFDSLEQEVYLNLWRTYDKLRAIEDELFDRHELTAQQYNALRLLRGRHPEPMATLALSSGLISRAPDITRLLDKLEERALISRQRPRDNRRVVLVAITEAGLALLQLLDDQVRTCHEHQLAHLNRADLKTLIALLQAARRPHEMPTSDWV